MTEQCFKIHVSDGLQDDLIFVKGSSNHAQQLRELCNLIIADLQEYKTKTITIDLREVN